MNKHKASRPVHVFRRAQRLAVLAVAVPFVSFGAAGTAQVARMTPAPGGLHTCARVLLRVSPTRPFGDLFPAQSCYWGGSSSGGGGEGGGGSAEGSGGDTGEGTGGGGCGCA